MQRSCSLLVVKQLHRGLPPLVLEGNFRKVSSLHLSYSMWSHANTVFYFYIVQGQLSVLRCFASACRFSGSQQIAPAVFQPSNASNVQSAALLYSDIDGEIAQHLRRLSKRDPTTKVKALQVCTASFPLTCALDGSTSLLLDTLNVTTFSTAYI